MSLIDKLREAAPEVAPSDLPTVSELLPLVGTLIAYVEQGDKLFEAAPEADASAAAAPVAAAPSAPPVADVPVVANPVVPEPLPVEAAPVDPIPAPEPTPADQLQMLEKQAEQLQTAIAALKHGEAS